MNRNITHEALVLSTKIQGENNKNVCLFSPDEGVFYSTLYGGGKSKYKSLVVPFNRGTIWIYKDETKKLSKITDFDVKSYHLSFRESLFKTWAATLACELIIKTNGAGSYKECWSIVNGFLDGMELCSETESKLGLIRFMWRFITLLGIKPQTQSCCYCGSSFIAGKFTTHTLQYKASYEQVLNGFACSNCVDLSHSNYTLGKSAITYLEAISNLTPKQVRQIIIDEQSVQEMKSLCFYLLETACGSKIKSIQTGIGIL